MTLTIRRTLAVAFACLFVVIALASIAYGRGYRFDPKTRQVRLTGVILLAGAPNRIQVSVDEGKIQNLSLPTTLRGLLPGTHTISVSAPGYGTQTFTLNVRSGQTTFASSMQLYRTNPFTTVRTGIPSTAVLAPDGSSVAWLEAEAIVLANPTSTVRVPLAQRGDTLAWSTNGEDIRILDANQVTLATISSSGVLRGPSYITPTKIDQAIRALVDNRLAYESIQRIPNSEHWLLLDATSAWVLQPDGVLGLVTRWGNEILNVVHLGRENVATVRRTDVLVRNIANSQTWTYDVPDITQARGGVREGEMNLLVADGDLLQWQRGNLFTL